ncbi:MAG: SDR family oxidoreductase [Deltaproteobacteria bacterium]|nr:SDR family oxidoreductase [Deltaproteobacteria bacterium]
MPFAHVAADRILLTGATGFLGRELARRIAGTRPLGLLVRRRDAESDSELRDRIGRSIFEGTAPRDLEIIAGDVTKTNLGISGASRKWLERGRTQIVHGAAQVRFDLPLEEMQRQNVNGTKNVITLAEALDGAGALERLDYVSTCYVAGDRTDLVLEADLDRGQRPRNVYEHSKLEAERELRRAMERELPVVVHRPSIIVGDSETGRASSFKVLYWPMKIYVRGRFSTIFGRPSCPIDVVSVDFVASAIAGLLDEPRAAGKTLHLAAGPQGQATIGELVDLAERLLDGPSVDYIDPEIYLRYLRPVVRPILRTLRPDVAEGAVFLPYLAGNPSFDTTEALALLTPRGISARPVLDYFDVIIRYAIESDFGKKELPKNGASKHSASI